VSSSGRGKGVTWVGTRAAACRVRPSSDAIRGRSYRAGGDGVNPRGAAPPQPRPALGGRRVQAPPPAGCWSSHNGV